MVAKLCARARRWMAYGYTYHWTIKESKLILGWGALVSFEELNLGYSVVKNDMNCCIGSYIGSYFIADIIPSKCDVYYSFLWTGDVYKFMQTDVSTII